jgi:predicted aconitase with swiveling domain
MASELRGRPIVPGEAQGIALVLEDGLSFAMAFDPVSGEIRDVHSGSAGLSVVGRVLVMPSGRGSSSASTSLAEALRLGTAPVAIVLSEIDEILAVGSIVGKRLYGRSCPIVILSHTERARIQTGAVLTIAADGTIDTT